MKKIKLYYIYDPMCSWCYAFSKILTELENKLNKTIDITYVLGGLALFSNEDMPIQMQEKLQDIWTQINEFNGTTFNHDFWKNNKPRRSTYPACIAVICGALQNKEKEMMKEIQKAYYLNAKNPSNEDTLVQCAKNINIDIEQFKKDYDSKNTLELFNNHLNQRRSLNVNSFPSLILAVNEKTYNITIDFHDENKILEQINTITKY